MAPAKKQRQRKTTAATGENVCVKCPSTCCHDLAIEIERPKTRFEIEELKWHLFFDTVSIFIAKRRWHLLVKGRCRYLGPDSLCTIYDHRPPKCREHNPPDCEEYDQYWDVMLRTPEELEDYLRGGARKR